MNWIINNWSFLVVIVAVFVVGSVYTKKFVDLPTDAQIEKLKEYLLYCVVMAEKELGSGTGAIKLRYVWSMVVNTYPEIAKVISFDLFSALVDEVLEEMKHLLETNKDIEFYVKGE